MIKFLVMDVDGTLTDGKIYYSSSGSEIRSFNIKDGFSIKNILPTLGIIPIIITGRNSIIVDRRARELGVKEVYQNVSNKCECLYKVMEKYNFNLNDVAFIGDDFNDIDIINLCGLTACPNDAIDEVKGLVDIVLRRNGGDGAVYEFISKIKQEDNKIGVNRLLE